MPLDCKKLKEKYEDLLQERNFFVLEYEKFKKGNDKSKEAKELRARLEASKKEIREILKYPGYIYEHLKNLAKISNLKIKNLGYINVLSNGNIAGVITDETQGDFIFIDNEIKKVFDGVVIKKVKDFIIKENGEIAVYFIDTTIGGAFFLKDGKLNHNIFADHYFTSVSDLRLQIDGSVTGKINSPHRAYCFVDNEIINQVGGTTNFFDINFLHKRENGLWVGTLSETKTFPFIGDKTVEKIEDEIIFDAQDIHTQPNGDLAGRVQLGGKYYPFHGGNVVRDIAGIPIEKTGYVATTPQGNLVGKVKVRLINIDSHSELARWRWRIFKDNSFIQEIAGKKIDDLFDVKCDSRGNLYGAVYIEGKVQLFYGNELFDTISGKDIESVSNIIILQDGTLYGKARPRRGPEEIFVFDGEKYIFVDEVNKE